MDMLRMLIGSFLSGLGCEGRRKDKTDNNLRSFLLSDVDRKLGYHLEEEANECIMKVRAHTMLPYVRLVTLYQQAVHCEKNGIRGSLVECGVWKGGPVGIMALANINHGKGSRH